MRSKRELRKIFLQRMTMNENELKRGSCYCIIIIINLDFCAYFSSRFALNGNALLLFSVLLLVCSYSLLLLIPVEHCKYCRISWPPLCPCDGL